MVRKVHPDRGPLPVAPLGPLSALEHVRLPVQPAGGSWGVDWGKQRARGRQIKPCPP